MSDETKLTLSEARALAFTVMADADESIRQERLIELLTYVHDPIAEEALRIVKSQAKRIEELERRLALEADAEKAHKPTRITVHRTEGT